MLIRNNECNHRAFWCYIVLEVQLLLMRNSGERRIMNLLQIALHNYIFMMLSCKWMWCHCPLNSLCEHFVVIHLMSFVVLAVTSPTSLLFIIQWLLVGQGERAYECALDGLKSKLALASFSINILESKIRT